MRRPAVGVLQALVLGLALFGSSSASAVVERRWCAVIRGHETTSEICTFDTLEQCREEVLGVGGWCKLNSYFKEPEAQPARGSPPPQGSRPKRGPAH